MKIVLKFIIIIFLVACAQGENMILEYEDAQFFKVRELQSGSISLLEVSGLAFHSSLAVKNVETKIEDDCMLILVYMTPTKKGLSGNFMYSFEIPKNINSVCFKSNKHLIWKRNTSQ